MKVQLETNEDFQNFFKNESNYITETLKKNKELLNAKSPDGSNLLHWACSYDNKQVMKYLVESKVDVNLKNNHSNTPLHQAFIDKADIGNIKYLVENKADLNLKDNRGYTPFFVARANNTHIETIKYLVKMKADIDLKNDDGDTLLHEACFKKDNIENIYYLVDNKSDLNLKNNIGNTPLYIAILNNTNIGIIKQLVESKARIDQVNNSGDALLHISCFNTNEEKIVNYLVKNKSDINLKNNIGNTPLYMAIHNNAYIETIIYLVESKADANSINNDGKSSLHKACADNVNIKIIQYLVGKTNHANIKIAICAAWAGGALEKINGSLISGKKFDSNEIFNYFKFPSENQNSKFWKSTNYEKSLDQVSDEIKEGLELNFNKLFKQIFFKTFIDEAMQNGCQIMFWDKIYSSSPKTNGAYCGATKNISIFINPERIDLIKVTGTIFHELEHFYNNHEFKNDSKPHGPEDNALKKLWSKLVDKHVIPSKGVFHNICKAYDKDKYTIELPAWIFGKIVEEMLNNNSDWMTKNFDLVRAVWDNILKGLNNDLTLSDFVGEEVLNKVLINGRTTNTINMETINYLVENKADINAKDEGHLKPLEIDQNLLVSNPEIISTLLTGLTENQAGDTENI